MKNLDEGIFEGLTRDNLPITKTYDGNEESLLADVHVPPKKEEITYNY